MPPKAAEDNHIKVAVRVRPFNQRELESNAKLVISMEGPTTTITDPTGRGPPRPFTFDYSYWSFDGFDVDESGVCVPTDPKYADQRRVFNDLGVDVVKNAFLGYNAAIFAYGQTGSGKSYSIIGYNNNKGLVPLTCEALFEDIARNRDISRTYQVTFSMLEIYNEKVRDLLNPQTGNPGGLKVRQSPKSGFFVEGLKHVAVSSYADIEHWMGKGTVLRTTASTKMNETSSRSHMVITINFKQVHAFEWVGWCGCDCVCGRIYEWRDVCGESRCLPWLMHTHSLLNTLTHSLTHSLARSLTHSLTH
jgi:kinesin family protein 1